MAKLISQKNALNAFLLIACVALQSCASTEELFAEYDNKFCVVPELPSQKLRWEPVAYFESDEAKLLPRAIGKLQINVKVLKKLPDYKISLKGFTDHQASDDYNQKLSVKRVEAVKNYLIEKHNIASDRIIGSAHGENSPLTSILAGPVDADRRVEMLLINPELIPVPSQPLVSLLENN